MWWQGVGACHRGRDEWYGVRPMAWMETHSRGGACGMVWGHVAGCGNMSQGVGSSGRVWEHVTGCGLKWQGVEACHNRLGHMAGGAVGTCGRHWGHVAGGWHVVGVVAYCRV